MAGTKIIAYDLGTGGSKASLFDTDGTCLAFTFVPYDTLYPDTGWHEQRPEDWWKAIRRSTAELLAKRIVSPPDIACLAISGQSLGVVPVDRSGTLLREATPIWSDTRASRADRCVLQEGGPGEVVHDHGQRVSRRVLLAVQGDVVQGHRAGDVRPGAQGHRHQGLHQPEADGRDRDGLLLRLGQRCLQPRGLGLQARAHRGRRACPRAVPRDRPLHEDPRHTDARSLRRAGPSPHRAGRLRRRGQLLHGAGGEKHRGRQRLHIPGLLLLDRGLLEEAGARLQGQALRVHARGAGAVHLSGEHLLGRQLPALDPGHPLRRLDDRRPRRLRGHERDGSFRTDRREQAAVQPEPGRRRHAGVQPRISGDASRASTCATPGPTLCGRAWKASRSTWGLCSPC